MLHQALDAFARMDVEAAISIAASDIKINQEFESIQRLLITHMMEDPREVRNVIQVNWCARALERMVIMPKMFVSMSFIWSKAKTSGTRAWKRLSKPLRG